MVQRRKNKYGLGWGRKEKRHMGRDCNFYEQGQGGEKRLRAAYFDFLLDTFEFEFFF